MKINLWLTISAVLLALAFFFVSDQAESLDIKRMILGTVKEIKTDSIKVLEDTDAKEVRIAIDSNTVYDNVQKSADLKAGDKVQVEYQTSHDKNIAITITKIEMESQKGGRP